MARDPEKKREAQRRYREKNKEKIKEYRQNNKEHTKEYQKEYYQNNNEKLKEYNQSPQGIKRRIISDWKRRGLIHEDMDALYEIYINTERCDVCKKHFSNTYDRCMDHDHSNGLYRHILCRGCNTNDNWKNKVTQ